MDKAQSEEKPFPVTMNMVTEAHRKVKTKGKAYGVDGVSMKEFEEKLTGNLYKIWNRLASGTYFPPAVREFEIPKKDGKMRKLGIPTIGDRIAQTVDKDYMEASIDKLFHKDSYGYRPMKSAYQALPQARINVKKVDWANRPLYFYWNRRHPELYSNMAIQEGNMKLVGHADYDAKAKDFELFNISKDPGEQHNQVAEDTKLATTMKRDLDQMLNDLVNSKNLLTPLRIVIGSDKENSVILNRNDSDGQHDIGTQQEVYGLWKVSIFKKGMYNIRFKFIKPVLGKGKMHLGTKPIVYQMQWNQIGMDRIEMKNVHFEQMDYDFVLYYSMRGKKIFPFWVEVEKVD